MKGMSDTMQIIVAVVVILVTALLIVLIVSNFFGPGGPGNDPTNLGRCTGFKLNNPSACTGVAAGGTPKGWSGGPCQC